MRIEVYRNDVGKAYKVLQKKLNAEGVLKKLKEKEYYVTPSEQRRIKHKRAVARDKKQEKKRLAAIERAEARGFRRNAQTSRDKFTKKWKHPSK